MLASLPAHAQEVAESGGPANECVVDTTAVTACVQVDDPSLGSPAPTVKSVYVWVGPGACADGLTVNIPTCRGTPAGPGSTAGVFGIVYQESNLALGLQRDAFDFNGITYSADRMVLV